MNSRVFSIAATFCGSSTTQMIRGSRASLLQKAHGIDGGDVVAHRAVGDALLDVAQRVDETLGLLARRLEDVERETLRALRADAGQALEFLDESDERIW